ncbi:MAG TPA: hypothetical protein VNO31_31370, partial [Umezawaea sp.]|nr:hypothetical protein [Umezawaea sp.]
MTDQWIRGPIGLDADRRVTVAGCRTVLVVVPHPAAGTRLISDVIPLLRNDNRVQVIFSVSETGKLWHGTEEFVRRQGGLVVPWHQAVENEFDLVLAAGYNDLEQVHGRVLLLPHGASSLASRKFGRHAGKASIPLPGLSRETLVHRGRLLPSAIALTHDDEVAALRESCPEALGTAVVVGDVCLDRMVASAPRRGDYRRALGVADDQRLVTISSTWSRDSTFGTWFELCGRLLDELPRRDHRVAAILHPNIWAVHGAWQVRAWLDDHVAAGLLLIPPDEGWRATTIASDLVLGDHGSTTQYAAAIGTPVLLAAFPQDDVREGSPADVLARTAPKLDPDGLLLPQFGK